MKSILLIFTAISVLSCNSFAVIADREVTAVKVHKTAMDGRTLNNLGLATSVGSSALTIALKQNDGTTNPTATRPVDVAFRSATVTSGAYTMVSATGALSVVISSGSTLGTTSAVEATLFVYAINNAGAMELAVIHGTELDESLVYSTTAEGGSGGADTAGVLYSTTARTNVPVRLIGKIVITEATAGTWASNATTLSIPPFKPKTPMIAGVSYFTGSGNSSCYVNTTTPTDCGTSSGINGPTVEFSNLGTWATTDADKFQQTITNLPAGTYEVELGPVPWYITSNSGNCVLGLTDGTTFVIGSQMTITGNGSAGNTIIRGFFRYTAPQATVSYRPAVISCGSAVTDLYQSSPNNDMRIRFSMKYFPN